LIIYVFDWIAIDSNTWFGIFGIQVVVYLIILSRLRRTQMNQSELIIGMSS